MSPSLRRLATLLSLLLVPAALHCGQTDESTAFATDERGGPTGPTPSASATATGSVAVPAPGPPNGGGVEDAGLEQDAGPPPAGVLLVHAHATLPALRICPAAPGATPAAPLSTARFAPLPSTLMPHSSLAGVDAQGAVFMAPDPGYAAVRRVVLVLLNESTKANASLATGACSALACLDASPCVGAANLRLVDLPDEGLFAKDGTVLTLTGTSDSVVAFTNSRLKAAPASRPGRLSAQLLNASTYTGAVQLRSEATVSQVVELPASLPYTDYGARLEAGAHQETLLQVFENAGSTGSTAAFFEGAPHALVLVGSPATGAPRSLKFLSIPLRL
jgi:hypothetical protein